MIDGSVFNHPTNQPITSGGPLCACPGWPALPTSTCVSSSSKKYLFSFKRGSQYLIDFLIDFAFPEEVELVSVVGTDENEFLNFCVSFCETKKKSIPIRRVHPTLHTLQYMAMTIARTRYENGYLWAGYVAQCPLPSIVAAIGVVDPPPRV